VRSDVVAGTAAARSARAALHRERAAGFPAIGIGAFYEDDAGRTYAGPLVALELPLWDRNQTGVASAKGRLVTAEADAERRVSVAAAEQRTAELALADVPVLRPIEETFAEAQAALESVDAGYRGGELDLQTTLLLQDRILAGRAGALEQALSTTELRLDLLLANDDAALLPGGAP
jgi:hypothetical protein